MNGRRGRQRMVIPFLLPAFLLYTVFFVYPAIQAFWVSLHDWSGFGQSMVYIGMGNYQEMMKDAIFSGLLSSYTLHKCRWRYWYICTGIIFCVDFAA